MLSVRGTQSPARRREPQPFDRGSVSDRTDVARRVQTASRGLKLAEAGRGNGGGGKVAEDHAVVAVVELPADKYLGGILGGDGLAVVDALGEIALDRVDPGEAV